MQEKSSYVAIFTGYGKPPAMQRLTASAANAESAKADAHLAFDKLS